MRKKVLYYQYKMQYNKHTGTRRERIHLNINVQQVCKELQKGYNKHRKEKIV